MDLYSTLSHTSETLRYDTQVIQGLTQFYLPPNTSHTCLYSPAIEDYHPLAGAHCAYPWRDGQAELAWMVG